MNPKLDFIFNRRSIRKFSPELVSDALIRDLLEAAMAAPSAMNIQSWHFVVVREPELLENLHAVMTFGKMAAPLAIVVCGDLGNVKRLVAENFWIQDCSAATENLLLAASALGLGAVWCGVSPLKTAVKRVSDVLKLPSTLIPLNVIFVGHPNEVKEPGTKFNEKKVSYDRFKG
jgi:nitroreductase